MKKRRRRSLVSDVFVLLLGFPPSGCLTDSGFGVSLPRGLVLSQESCFVSGVELWDPWGLIYRWNLELKPPFFNKKGLGRRALAWQARKKAQNQIEAPLQSIVDRTEPSAVDRHVRFLQVLSVLLCSSISGFVTSFPRKVVFYNVVASSIIFVLVGRMTCFDS